MTGIERIGAERQRQIGVEGYDEHHDKGHAEELINAARCYALAAERNVHDVPIPSAEDMIFAVGWPWGKEHWKPSRDAIRNLEKAGALIAAAIDSLENS